MVLRDGKLASRGATTYRRSLLADSRCSISNQDVVRAVLSAVPTSNSSAWRAGRSQYFSVKAALWPASQCGLSDQAGAAREQ